MPTISSRVCSITSRGATGERREVDLNALVDEALNLAYRRRERATGASTSCWNGISETALAPIELAPQDMTCEGGF